VPTDLRQSIQLSAIKNVHVGDVYVGHGERSTASPIGDVPLFGNGRVIESVRGRTCCR
jgi:hypothetical protein